MLRQTIGCAVLIITVSIAVHAQGQKHMLTPRDVLSLKYPQEAALSAAGDRVLFTVREPDFSKGKFNVHLWMLTTESPAPRQLTFSEGSVTAPAWSADGRWITFLSNRPYQDNNNVRSITKQLWVLSTFAGEAIRVTDFSNGVKKYLWFPISHKILCLTEAPETATEEGGAESPLREGFDARRRGEAKPDVEFWIIDLDAHTSKKLCATDPGVAEFDISGDGRWIVYSTNYTGEMNEDQQYDLWLLSTKTGVKRQITDFPGPETSPAFSPNSTYIAYLTQTVADIECAETDLCVMNLDGLVNVNLTAGYGRAVHDPVWAADGSAVYITVADGTTTPLYKVTVFAGECTPFTPLEGNYSNLDFSANGAIHSYLREDAHTLPEIYINSTAATEQCSHFSAQLDNYRLGDQKVVHYYNEDFEIEALVLLPVDYNEESVYPLLLFVHGGPYGRFVNTFRQSLMLQVFANRGYVVLAPNPRGSAGYSDEFGQANINDTGGADYRDLMAGVLYMSDSGISDYERMGIIGGSYGGYLTNWAITQTDRFAAAVSINGIFSLLTDFSNSVQPLWEKMYLGNYYWEHITPYLEHSPAFYAQYIATPVLILHGEEDELTFISNSMEMYRALTTMGKTVEFVTYPGEGHGINSEPDHILDKFDRILAWFEKYVKSAGKGEIEIK